VTNQRTIIQSAILIILVAFLLAYCSGNASAQSATLTPAQRMAAEVAAGEAPVSLVGVGGYVGMICTMTDRLESPRFPNTLLDVLNAYYAPPRALTAQEEAIAIDVLVYGSECDGGPYFWALSYQDVARRGLRDGDWVTAPYVLASGVEMGIHFYKTSPWGNQ